MRRLLTFSAVIIALDQLSKLVILHYVDLDTRLRVDVWAPFFTLRMAWNEGINFGLLGGADMRWALIALSLVICAAALWWLRRATGWHVLAGGLLVGGAIGNVIDRLAYGAVVDFLNMSCCGIDNPYAFNVADIAIFAGAALLAVLGEPGNKTA